MSTNGRCGEEIKLPPGKILIPGVISHCVYQVEHPELVAQRSSATPASSAARTSSRATTAALRPPPPATRCIPKWPGRSWQRSPKARASRRSGCFPERSELRSAAGRARPGSDCAPASASRARSRRYPARAAPVSGSISALSFSASARNAGSFMVASQARRRISMRSAGTPGGAASGRAIATA